MNKTTETFAMPGWLRSWEQFWFTPADPALLGLIRICCGLIVVYTIFVYGFSLQDMVGEHAWNGLDARMEVVRHRPVHAGGYVDILPEPRNEFEMRYRESYKAKFNGALPPPPYPKTDEEADLLDKFIEDFKVDLRVNGLRIPATPWEWEYVRAYTAKHRIVPPAYARDQAEADRIDEYIRTIGHDPRRLATEGMRVFSIWFDVTDPDAMLIVHRLIVVITVLFTLGFCTRITSALMWFGSLCYIHRNPTMLFGVDTMMTILLLYLMIGPSGDAFSLDALIRRWWSKAKPGWVQAWCRFWRRPVPDVAQIAPAPPAQAAPSVSANVAIRLLQIHVGIIYLMAGLSKLLGSAWWTGDALWGTLGNFEFAPMEAEWYLAFIAFLGRHRWLYHLFTTGGGLFTLAFEISYIFLIWRPKLRWILLGAAILLHGFIGLLMGLKTFSLMMLVMNMAFLRPEEVQWLMGRVTWVWSLFWREPARPQVAVAAAAGKK
jgi:hypothetical protein